MSTPIKALFAIDSLEVRIIREQDETPILWLKKPSNENITARILAETTAQAAKPLGENHLFHCPLINLAAGEELIVANRSLSQPYR